MQYAREQYCREYFRYPGSKNAMGYFYARFRGICINITGFMSRKPIAISRKTGGDYACKKVDLIGNKS